MLVNFVVPFSVEAWTVTRFDNAESLDFNIHSLSFSLVRYLLAGRMSAKAVSKKSIDRCCCCYCGRRWKSY